MKTTFKRKDPEVIAFAFANALPVFVEKYEAETYSTKENLKTAYHSIRSEGVGTSSKTGLSFTKNTNTMQNQSEETEQATEVQVAKPAKVAKVKVEKAPKAPKAVKVPKEPKVKVEKAPKQATKADQIRALLLTGKTSKEIQEILISEGKNAYPSEISSCIAILVKTGQMQAPVKVDRSTKNQKGFIDPGDGDGTEVIAELQDQDESEEGEVEEQTEEQTEDEQQEQEESQEQEVEEQTEDVVEEIHA